MLVNKNIISKALNLSRWRDFLNFTLPVTLLAYGLGVKQSGSKVNWISLLVVLSANILAMAFAFIINELEDYEDDGKKIDVELAKALSIVTPLISLLLYSTLGKNTFIIGFFIIALSFLYSWKKVRLKAYPIVDVLSHCLMLGGLIFMSAFLVNGTLQGKYYFVFLAVTLVSAYGQFYNQVRDFKEDKKAGLRNTSILIGYKLARISMYSCIFIALIFIALSFISILLPFWFIYSGIVIFIFTTVLYKTKIKERDIKSGVPIVNIQTQFLITLTILSLVYLFLA